LVFVFVKENRKRLEIRQLEEKAHKAEVRARKRKAAQNLREKFGKFLKQN
jgi:hypothetical protein